MQKFHLPIAQASIALLLLFATSTTGQAQTFNLIRPTNAAQAKLSQLMTYYYATEQKPSVGALLAQIDDSGILQKDWENTQFPVLGFLSQIFAANPDALSTAIGENYSRELKKVILLALMLDYVEARAPAKYQAAIARIPVEKRPPPIRLANITHPKILDMLWGALCASGDTAFLDQILAVLEARNGPTDNPKLNQLLGAVAAWAIKSNMFNHAMVERHIRKRAENAPLDQAKLLNAIISEFEKGLASLRMDASDGYFSAMAVVTDSAIIEELKKPPHRGIRVVSKHKYNRGEDIYVHIGFTGMEVSDRHRANVTFSASIALPDGHRQELASNRKALVGSAPMRFSVFSARDFPLFRLPYDAPLGDYVLHVTLTDNLSEKSLELTAPFRLVE